MSSNPFTRARELNDHLAACSRFCRDLPTIPENVTAGELVEALREIMTARETVGAGASIFQLRTRRVNHFRALLTAFKGDSHG